MDQQGMDSETQFGNNRGITPSGDQENVAIATLGQNMTEIKSTESTEEAMAKGDNDTIAILTPCFSKDDDMEAGPSKPTKKKRRRVRSEVERNRPITLRQSKTNANMVIKAIAKMESSRNVLRRKKSVHKKRAAVGISKRRVTKPRRQSYSRSRRPMRVRSDSSFMSVSSKSSVSECSRCGHKCCVPVKCF